MTQHCFARWSVCFLCVLFPLSFRTEQCVVKNLEYIYLKRKAHLSPPMEDRHLVEERKENRANFREEQKAV